MQMLSSFEKQLKNALKWYNDPEKLGNESPLASAYFLSRAIHAHPDPTSMWARGEALQIALRTAMQQAVLDYRQQPGTRRYSYLVMELRCFRQMLRPRRTADIWESDAYLLGHAPGIIAILI